MLTSHHSLRFTVIHNHEVKSETFVTTAKLVFNNIELMRQNSVS
jgi:hypothetical protein